MAKHWMFAVFATLSFHAVAAQDCPAGWKSFGNSCYLFVLHTPRVPLMTWEDARTYCMGFGGDLVSIINSSEVNFIYNQTKDMGNYKFWIGLYRNKTTSNSRIGWIWSDGNTFTNFYQWHFGEPNNYKNNENCAEVFAKSTRWNDNDCSKKFSSICERRKGLPIPTTPTFGTRPPTKDPPPSCDIGWEAFNRSCYKFESVPRSWSEAKKACANTGGHLVKIDSADEEMFLTFKVRPFLHQYWIGLNDLAVAGRWVWESFTKELVTFTNWQSGEPNGLGKERCTEMYGGSQAGFWNDAPCANVKRYICEKEEGKNMCPENWIPYNDSCYQFNFGPTQLMTWRAAKNACNSTGGFSSLLTIKSKDEQDFIKKQISSSSPSEVWIGLSDIDTEAIFKWTDGSFLSDTKFLIWANGNPTENNEDNDCVLMLGVRTDGAWSVQSCSLRRNFICKRNRDLVFCNQPLGMENGNILDSQITASSSHSVSNDAPKARFGHNSSWCPARSKKDEYLQVDFGSPYNVRAIVIDGNVTSFSLRYGNDGKKYRHYLDTALSSLKRPSRITLDSLTARFIRVYPLHLQNSPCLRVEFIGCAAQVPKSTDCSGTNWEKGPGNLCYQINTSLRKWTDARSMCLEQGGDLLTIATDKEKITINKRIKVLNGISSLWISLNDRDFKDVQYWSDGEAAGLFNWESGSPSNRDSDRYNMRSCVELRTSTGLWHDISCDSRRPFICMKRVGRRSSEENVVKTGQTGVWMSSAKYYWPLSNLENNITIGTRPGKVYGNIMLTSGVKSMSNSSLQFVGPGAFIDAGNFGKECLTFPNACNSGLTVSFMASFDNETSKWKKRVYILDSVGDERNSVGLAVYVENKQLWFVVAGKYQFYMENIALDSDETWRHYAMRWNESAIYIYVNAQLSSTGTFRRKKSSSDQQKNFLIGIQAGSQVTSGRLNLAMVAFWESMLTENDITSIYKSEFGQCPFGWIEFGMSCYQFNTDKKYYDQATRQCQSLGGDLVSIESSVEQSFLTPRVLARSWIGVHDRDQEDVFRQTNNDVIKYSNWNGGEPNNYNNEDCTEIYPKTGVWNDMPCYWLLSYICEKPKELSVKPVNISTANIPKFQRICEYTRATIGCPVGLVIRINSAFWGRRRRDVCGYISITNCGINGVATTTKSLRDKCDHANDCEIHASWMEPFLGDPCRSIRKYLEVNYTCVTGMSNKKCDTEWKISRDNGACYRLFNFFKTWKEARTTCQSYSADLISITTRSEQFMATSLMERTWNSNVWTGLNDLKTKGVYEWSDNSTVRWTKWYAGQPDERRTDESCVYMSLDRSKRGWMFWRDGNCSSTFAFMCKKTVGSQKSPTSTPAVSTGSCPQGWSSYNSPYCYRVINFPKKTWLEARKYCRQIVWYSSSINLASISDKNENDFIQKLSNFSMWIGLESRGVFRGHRWSDDKPVAYTNWDIGQPDSYNGLEACVLINPDSGLWSDERCDKPMPFVCKKPKSKNPASTPAPTSYPTPGSLSCKQGWTLFNDMCYIVGNDSSYDLKTWHDAESTCRSMNGHLTSINSEAEKSFLRYLIKKKKTFRFWIGLNDIGSESNYKWTDGTGYGSYYNWNSHEPNDHKRQEDCTEMFQSNGKWNDQHCSRKLSYICKSYNESFHPMVTIGPPRPWSDSYCAPGWVVNGRWCYEFHTDPSDYRTWFDARDACERGHNSSDYGQLVSIADEIEEAFLTVKIKGARAPLWTGLNSHHGYNSFFWVDNSPAKYYKWNTKQPRYGWNSCVEIVPYRWAAGRWNSVSCYKKNGYICKTAASTTPITATPAQTPTPTGPPSFTCPQDYKVYDESCYKFVKTAKTFDDARKTCNNEKAELISIESQFEQAYLVYILERFTGNVWIGLLHEPYSTFKFSDHSSPIYTYWGSGQPNRALGQRSCTQANVTGSSLGRWDDVDCNNKNKFVCEIYNGEPKVTIPVNSSCSPGWRQYDKYCYKHFDEWKTWSQAQYACSVHGSDLLSIHDDREQDFLIYHYQDRHPISIWTGLNDRNLEQGYNWADNTGVNYVNWRAGEPNDRDGAENCVEMQTRSGQWNDLSCNRRLPFMCKHKLECSSVLQINPSMITVTESSNTSLGANEAIIKDDDSNDLAWCTNNTSGNAKLTVDLNRLVQITKISIQGRNTPTPQFVRSFRIDYERDEYWKTYKYSYYQTIIQGNLDGKNVITRKLDPSINLDGISITPVTWKGQEICMKIRLYGCDYVCQYNLIRPPGRLTQDFITASSSKLPTNGPNQASQLGRAWCAEKNDRQQWLQVNFDDDRLISKIRTFGDDKDSYVKSYKIQFSGDGDNWIDYKQHGTVRIFKGNDDAVHPVVHILSNSIEASYVRILPLTWNKNICFRFMLLGCRADCDKPLLQNNANVKLSSSDQTSHPEYALFTSGKSWCTSKSPLKDQYLQIDFGNRVRATKIATQGSPLSYGKAREVLKFTLKFKRRNLWRNVLTKDKKQIRIFSAVNEKNPSKPMINEFHRRRRYGFQSLRIYPADFNGTEICMRVQIYGCPEGVEVIPTTESTTQNVIDVSVRFTSVQWDDRMSDKESEEFLEASKKIENAVRIVYEDSKAFRDVEVKELRKGSVVAVLKLVFNPAFSENGTETQPLENAVKTGKVGSLEVDKESFKIIELKPQAKTGDKKGGLSGGAVAAVVITVLLLVCLAIAGGILFYRRRQQKQLFSPQHFENPISYSSKAYDMEDSTVYT